MFEVTNRDGAARIGILSIGNKTITTPSIIFIDNERFLHQDFPSQDYLTIQMKNGLPLLEKEPMVQISDIHCGIKLSGDPHEIANNLITMREKAGYSQALYIPGTGIVHDYAQFVYTGVDLFDASRLIIHARKGYYLTHYGAIPGSEWRQKSCPCPACTAGQDDFTARLLHNYLIATNELETVKEFIARSRLRHLVEMRARARPHMVSLLRFLDGEHYPFFRKRIPFTGGGILGVSEDSLHSPEVKYYRERLHGYKKPGGDILLLLPCSARKPYSTSKSHRLFSRVIRDFQGDVHEVIVTSPLGLVPRELEGFYPQADYDISVTGLWSSEEKEMILTMLSSLMKENEYLHIINHTPYGFLEESLQETTTGNIYHTVLKNRPAGEESLLELRGVLEKISSSSSGIDRGTRREGSFRNMWIYQFGLNTDSVLNGKSVKGRFPTFKLTDGQQLGMFVPQARRISLTLKGGELLQSLERNRVFIDDFYPKGDIFAVGIDKADPGILVGSEVVILHGEEIRGVGMAMMNSEEMQEAERGVGVKVRHKKR